MNEGYARQVGSKYVMVTGSGRSNLKAIRVRRIAELRRTGSQAANSIFSDVRAELVSGIVYFPEIAQGIRPAPMSRVLEEIRKRSGPEEKEEKVDTFIREFFSSIAFGETPLPQGRSIGVAICKKENPHEKSVFFAGMFELLATNGDISTIVEATNRMILAKPRELIAVMGGIAYLGDNDYAETLLTILTDKCGVTGMAPLPLFALDDGFMVQAVADIRRMAGGCGDKQLAPMAGAHLVELAQKQ